MPPPPPDAPSQEVAELSNLQVVVKRLPPLRLHVTFGPGYPSQKAPSFTLTSPWLSEVQVASLCSQLDVQAKSMSGMPVVFAWAEWLRDCSLSHLQLADDRPLVLRPVLASRDPRAMSELESPMEALDTLQRFDREQGWWEWKQQSHTCQICFLEKPGIHFSEFGSCGHVYCSECLSEMLRVLVDEGSVTSLVCPASGCRTEVAPGVVERLAPRPVFERWHRLQVQQIIDTLPNVAFCPRCDQHGRRTPVLQLQDQDPSELPLAHCDHPACGYAFCSACREAYHPSTSCVAHIARLEQLNIKLEEARSRDASRRKRLQEELESLKMILAETVPCPKCHMPINRSQGCNHMVCSNCSTHFCYRCGTDITEVGYGHFSAAKCPTFDTAEVTRFQEGALGAQALEDELEELRRQFPEQANMVWNFQPPPGAWRRLARRRQAEDVPCPVCRQWNPRAGTNNHVKCRSCKQNFCYMCKKAIHGTVTAHFRGAGACPQHST